MGLFSGLKKFVKNIGSAIKKVFKPVMDFFGKVLNNKIVRGVLMATTLFTGGAALFSTLNTKGWGAAARMIIGKGADILVSPLKLISKGASALGSATGIQSLETFGQGLAQGLGNFSEGVQNILGASPETPLSGVVAQDAGISVDTIGGDQGLSTDPMDVVGVEAEPGIPGRPQGAELGREAFAGAGLPDQGGTGKQPGFLKKAVGWMEDNPELTKIGADAIASGLQKEPRSAGEQSRRNYEFRESAAKKANNPFSIQATSSPGMQQRAQQTRARADEARTDVKQQGEQARESIGSSISDMAGFGYVPKVYKPLFTGG